MRTAGRVVTAALAVIGLTMTACGPSAQTSEPVSDTRPLGRTSATSTPEQIQEEQMQLAITIDDQRLTATLRDSPASRDLLAQLPVTLQMRDHGSVEKTAPLPRPLSLAGQPTGADPDIGDVGYYSPGNDLVLYYGDQSYHDGIVILGRLDADAAARIAGLAGTITATISAANETRS